MKKLHGPHLVVVPLSVLFNWMNEFKKWCPSIKVLRLHCNSDKKEQLRLRSLINDKSLTEVVVTTYDTLKSEGWKSWLRLIVWRSVFLDEGHRGLLTDTNCFYESLTEELKLLFSVILNQIRTKKRFYNLQKFIE